jgi:hypothetical protein
MAGHFTNVATLHLIMFGEGRICPAVVMEYTVVKFNVGSIARRAGRHHGQNFFDLNLRHNLSGCGHRHFKQVGNVIGRGVALGLV